MLLSVARKLKSKLVYFYPSAKKYLYEFFFRNPKQKAWLTALRQLDKKKNILALETGRIRNPQWRNSDGNSTFFLSKLKNIQKLVSIDNDTENFSGFQASQAYCESYLSTGQLKKIEFLNGDSVTIISALGADIKFDFVLLDSANDPELIYNEYMAVKSHLNKEAILVVDDITFPGKKGDKLVPYLKSQGLIENFISAAPSNCCYFIIS